MNQKEFVRVFPLGTHLCREPMPSMSEMKHDMKLVGRKGFNLIKLQENWMVDEPREEQYDFAEVERQIRETGALEAGGIFIGSSSEIDPPIPAENFLAMVKNRGQRPLMSARIHTGDH